MSAHTRLPLKRKPKEACVKDAIGERLARAGIVCTCDDCLREREAARKDELDAQVDGKSRSAGPDQI